MKKISYHDCIRGKIVYPPLNLAQQKRLDCFVAETTKALGVKTNGCRYAKMEYALCPSQKCFRCETIIGSCSDSHCLNEDSYDITSTLNHAKMEVWKKIEECPCCSMIRMCSPCAESIENGQLSLPSCENNIARCRSFFYI